MRVLRSALDRGSQIGDAAVQVRGEHSVPAVRAVRRAL